MSLSDWDSQKWLNKIVHAAKKAYESIEGIIGTPLARQRIRKNQLGDTTLCIDKTAEDVILREMGKINQNIKVITEETGEFFTQQETEEFSDYLVIDPIDGSHNASFGFPMACISIAHAKGPHLDDVDAGVIMNIFSKDIFTAIKGKGAFRNGFPIHVNTRKVLPKCLFGMNLSVDETLADFVNRYAKFFDKCKPMRIRGIGTDGFALTLVGSGQLDLFLNLQNKTRTLDIAAAALILKEAGGILIDPYGNVLNSLLALTTRISFIGISPTLKKQLDPLIPILAECYKNQPSIL
ncbi:MAG: hypothetical protein JW776_13350 [Candidatus Lokiarchaeota archaeon]|nr:hypothetical protein [Candidatus Lokiarchaeota archaeon]